MEFEYDPAKSTTNLNKHGVDFESAQRLWEKPVLEFDAEPRSDDARYLVIGTMDGFCWTAIITYRGVRKDVIRIISVRRSNEYERDIYERYCNSERQ